MNDLRTTLSDEMMSCSRIELVTVNEGGVDT